MPSSEPLLSSEVPADAHFDRKARLVALAALALCTAFSAGVYLAPSLALAQTLVVGPPKVASLRSEKSFQQQQQEQEQSGERQQLPDLKEAAGTPGTDSAFLEEFLASGPLGLGGIFGRLGDFLGRVYDQIKPSAWLIKLLGILLFLPTFFLAGLQHGQDFNGFVGMMRGFGLPWPTFMAISGLICLLGGPVLMVTGVPVLMEWGAELILLFLIFGTYFGHYKPWTEGGSNDTTHFLMMLKNLSMAGACLMIIGYEIPEIGPS